MINNNDYILLMTEAIGRAIAKIIGLKEHGQYDKALDEIQIAYNNYFNNIDLSNENNFKKLDLYGKLIKLEADILFEENNESLSLVKELYLKADKHLKRAAFLSKTYNIERVNLIEQISSILKQF